MATLYEYYNTGDNTYISNFYGDTWQAQTFTPSLSHSVALVKLKLWRFGNPGTVTVSIKATDVDGKPTGADLTSGTTNGNTLTEDDAGEWREITLSSYALSSNTKYAIVVRALDGSDFNSLAWRGDDDAPTYTNGSRCASNDGGIAWFVDETTDFMFEEWGISAFVPRIFYF